MTKLFLNKFSSRKFPLLFLLLFIILLTFTRTYNLDLTARFTQDESSDLVRIHQYYESRKITLVGPISNDNTKVFSSLTYYMLIPFAAAYNFTPVSPAYGTVFWGILTAIIILLITSKINKKLLPFVSVLCILWYPLLQTSRWAWNPHLVIFWIALGIWFYLRKTRLSYFLSGISFGLAIHNHYIAIVATGIFICFIGVNLLLKKHFKDSVVLVMGYILPFIPFIIFDLRHPPGLFINRYLMTGRISNTQATTTLDAIQNVFSNFSLFCQYIAQNSFLAIIIGLLILAIFAADLKTNKKALLFIIPVIGQIIAGAFLDSLQTRYLLPGLVFFLTWLIFPRKSVGALLSRLALLILVIGCMFSIYPQLHFIEVQPDVRTIEKADKVITNLINTKNMKNVNLAVLGSESPDTFGINIRNALQVRDINFLATSQYGVSEQLIVLSTTDERSLRKDQSFSMQQFKNAELGGVYPVEKTKWKIYWFRKI